MYVDLETQIMTHEDTGDGTNYCGMKQRFDATNCHLTGTTTAALL